MTSTSTNTNRYNTPRLDDVVARLRLVVDEIHPAAQDDITDLFSAALEVVEASGDEAAAEVVATAAEEYPTATPSRQDRIRDALRVLTGRARPADPTAGVAPAAAAATPTPPVAPAERPATPALSAIPAERPGWLDEVIVRRIEPLEVTATDHERRITRLEGHGLGGGFNPIGALIGAIVGLLLTWLFTALVWDLSGLQTFVINLVATGVGAIIGALVVPARTTA